jgi:hypothetical protein
VFGYRQKIGAVGEPSRTPSKALSTANQKEMFRCDFSGVGFFFMTLSQAFKA